MKTILITGASSGIGKATAQLFYEKGWNVIATMRKPDKEKDLSTGDRMLLTRLDVEDRPSIDAAIAQGIAKFGQIDLLFNNAGYGTFGPLEAGTDEQIHKQYNVNFFGVIDCIKAILPHFKQLHKGMIINTTSMGGLMNVPLLGLYNSTKFAMEGLSEGLWYDLKPLGIEVKVVEPGVIGTDFGGRSLTSFDIANFPEYKEYEKKVDAKFKKLAKNAGSPKLVAEVVFKAATDGTRTLRYLVGKDAKSFWFIRRWFGYKTQMKLLSRYFGLAS